jgi:GntR family transcriptional regulator of vanillate catabolism
MSPPSRQQLRAVLRLRELVLSGHFKSGERIAELALVAKLGMSRTPVRVALNALAHEGLLRSGANGGFIVRDFSIAEIVDAIELRGVLEGTAARFAAERHQGAGALEPLSDVVGRLDRLLAGPCGASTFEAYVELNEVFHAQLLELAGSAMLERAMAQAAALPFASPSAFLHAQSETPQSLEILRLGQEHHRALLEAIGDREGERAEAIAREHARLARRNLSIVLDRRDLFRKVRGAALIRATEHGPAPEQRTRRKGSASDAA